MVRGESHSWDLSREGHVTDEVSAVVEEALPQGLYRVRCDDGHVVLASMASVTKQVMVRVLPGDRVMIEVSPLDPSRGRLMRRLD